jgi:hypothetical protein
MATSQHQCGPASHSGGATVQVKHGPVRRRDFDALGFLYRNDLNKALFEKVLEGIVFNGSIAMA